MWRSLFDRLAKSSVDQRPGLLQQEMPRLFAAYGGLLQKYPAAVVDSSKLPASKDELKAVLRMAWQMHTEGEQRAVIERGYRRLARFQEGVGDTPIPLSKGATSDSSDETHHWVAKVEAESKELSTEFDDFKRRCAKGQP
jgi:hypothetical protein